MYKKVVQIADKYQVSQTQIYELLRKKIFQDSIIRVGERAIRIDEDKFENIRSKYFRR